MWDLGLPGHCGNVGVWFLVIAVLNTATDFAILLLPIWILKPLRVPLRQKLAICGVIMAGGL